MSNENEASPFHLPGKTSPTASEDDEDSNVVKENLPDSENKAENPPADKNGAAAAADNNSKRAKKRKHLTRDEKARKKNQMATWVQDMKLRDVILTREGDDVETLGPMKCTDLPAEVHKIFMKANNIKLSHSLQKSSELVRNVANHMKAPDLKDQSKGPTKQKIAGAVKPTCITKDGNLFQVANNIIQKKRVVC